MISIGDAILKLGVDSDELDRDLQKAVSSVKDQMKAVGVAMTGIGVAITGSLVMMVKSAAEEEAGIIKLNQALKNVGVSYDDVRDSLEGAIDATQQKTSIADSKQREALAGLIALTNSYDKALELLPMTMDLAAAKGMDLASASDVIGRVAEGNTSILTRYGIQLKEGATATEALAELQKKYGGQAEAYGQSVAGQFALIKNNIGDLMEQIGATLLPILKELFDKHLNPLIQSFKAWADEHPDLIKQLVILVGVVGGFAAVLGPILIMLPTLIAAFTLLTGPIGLAVLAITALIAIGTLLWLNWDTISQKAKDIWGSIVKTIRDAWNNITNFILSGVNFVIDKVNSVISLINKVPGMNIGTIAPVGQQPEVPGMTGGGIIQEPTLLTSLKTMRPYAVAGEAGPEMVSPTSSARTADIRIYLDGHELAEALGQPLVDTIRIRTGVKV